MSFCPILHDLTKHHKEFKTSHDITSSIDLEHFRLEKQYERSIALEEQEGVLTPVGAVPIGLPPEEVTELLSNIIQVLNDAYGTNFTEGDKVKLEEIQRRIQANEEFRRVYEGDNTETGRRHGFDKVFEDVKLSLVEEDLEFYNKINDPQTNQYLKDHLYQSYS